MLQSRREGRVSQGSTLGPLPKRCSFFRPRLKGRHRAPATRPGCTPRDHELPSPAFTPREAQRICEPRISRKIVINFTSHLMVLISICSGLRMEFCLGAQKAVVDRLGSFSTAVLKLETNHLWRALKYSDAQVT